MNKGRLEAFSDGVIAIIITVMVLQMKVPHGDRLHDLAPVLPTFLSYALGVALAVTYFAFISRRYAGKISIKPDAEGY